MEEIKKVNVHPDPAHAAHNRHSTDFLTICVPLCRKDILCSKNAVIASLLSIKRKLFLPKYSE